MSQIKIPVHCVPRAPVDYDMEQQQILGQPLVLPDGFRVPPLTAARLMALELVCSDFFLHPATCADPDVAAAVVLVSCDRELVEELTADRSASADPSAARDAQATAAVEGLPSGLHGPSAAYPNLYAAATALLAAHGDAIFVDYPRLVRWILSVPFYGFNMRPKQPAPPRMCWFDGEFFGGILAPAAKLLATPVDALLWRTPLCTIGHAIAQQDASLGVKGVERPPDEKVLKRMMREAAEREARGELHPWQYADPETNPLSPAQFGANPALGPFYESLRAAFRKSGRRPLDPADYPLPDPPAPDRFTPPGPFDPNVTFTVSREASGLSVEDAGTAFSTTTVQDLSWSPRGSNANKDISL